MRFVFLLILVLFLTSCTEVDWNEGLNETFKDYRQPSELDDINITNGTIQVEVEDTIAEDVVFGSWNIQVFGVTKMSNEKVKQTIVDVIDDYDIIAIQEIRDKSGTAFRELMQELPEYDYVISERLGRTSSKEEYAFIYKPSRMNVSRAEVYPDDLDVFEREPYLVFVEMPNFDCVLIQTHIKPDDAQYEIRALQSVVEYAKEVYQDKDIFILGDLNGDCVYYDGGELKDYAWLITDDEDTTTGNTDCAYDRIISVYRYSDEFIYDCGVDRIDEEEATSKELLEATSDHFPISCTIRI